MNSYQLSGSRRREFDGQLAEPSRNSRVGPQDLAGLNSRGKRTVLAVSPARFVTTVTSQLRSAKMGKKRPKKMPFSKNGYDSNNQVGGPAKGGGMQVLGYTIPCLMPLSNQTLVEMMFPFHGRYTCVGFRPARTGSAGYVAY